MSSRGMESVCWEQGAKDRTVNLRFEVSTVQSDVSESKYKTPVSLGKYAPIK